MERIMPEPKPPSRPYRKLPRFLVGRDSRGRWVVLDQRHLSGGLFINRAEAIRYAMLESGRRPQAVIMVPGVIELDITQSVVTSSRQMPGRAVRALNR